MAYWENKLWKEDVYHLDRDKKHTIFDAKIIVVYLAIKIAKTRPSIHILSIYCDSQATIKVLTLNNRSSGCSLLDKVHSDINKL